jgi:glycosyltransferase involved in cell wall biosynthesis
MDSHLLSIIIPNYNNEDYIFSCLNSCVNSKVAKSRVEIVFIDDGSTDNSLNEVLKFSEEHDNVKIIKKQNAGVSSARNIGIQASQGRFITFLDSDDEINYQSFDSVIQRLLGCNTDLLVCNSVDLDTGNNVLREYPSQYRHMQITGKDLLTSGYVRGSACGIFYHRDLIINNNIWFEESISLGEDSFFVLKCLMNAENILYLDTPLYLVRENRNSVSRNWSIKKSKFLIKNANYVKDLVQTNRANTFESGVMNSLVFRYISGSINRAIEFNWIAGYEPLRSELKKHRLLPISTHTVPSNYLAICILNVSYTLFYILIVIRNSFKKAYEFFCVR